MGQVLANDLKRKLYILVDGQPYVVLEVTFASPSARGASTMVKARIRNLLNGLVQDKNFKTGEKFDEPDVEKVPAAFLYASGEEYHFMDNASYDQFMLTTAKLGEQKFYLKDGMEMQALKYNGEVVSLELPVVVELSVTETEPGIKGTSSSGRSTKKAVLETGLEAQVPLYIEPGTIVRVNTQTGEVTGRAT
jgi:elongation factor P